MSGKLTWTRRGEWLELMPGKLPARDGQDRLDAAMAWLEEGLQAPPKLLRRLRAEGGIKLAGDRLRLLAFPARASQYAPVEAELSLLYEDDFCLVVHKPAGLKVHPDGNEGALPVGTRLRRTRLPTASRDGTPAWVSQSLRRIFTGWTNIRQDRCCSQRTNTPI